MSKMAEIESFPSNDGDEIIGGAVPSDEQVLNNLFKKGDKLKVKRTVSHRQPRLGEHELCGPKGIQELKRRADKFKPKPEDNPYESLSELMFIVRHWAHSLYPKMKFEDVVSRIESIGSKRAVKLYMDRMRMGLSLDESIVPEDKDMEEKLIGSNENEDTDVSHPNEGSEPIIGDEGNITPGKSNAESSHVEMDGIDIDDFINQFYSDQQKSAEEVINPSSIRLKSQRVDSLTSRKENIPNNEEEEEDEDTDLLLQISNIGTESKEKAGSSTVFPVEENEVMGEDEALDAIFSAD